MAREWLDPNKQAVPPEIKALVAGDDLAGQALIRRGFFNLQSAKAFLDPYFYQPASPYAFPGMEIAVNTIWRAIKQKQLIGVWGDFDADGQTSTTLLVSALRALGSRVVFYIPNRERESHGVHIASLESLIDAGVKLLLTCDTGITANLAVDYAISRSVEVVITDHHLPANSLPRAKAIINPHLLPTETHPLSSLPGVGVAYKLIEAMYESSPNQLDCQPLLDLAAIGIVADLAPIIGEARWQLQKGLPLLRSTKRRALLELLALADFNPENINEEHIAYIIAPRLNALGRLSDANSAVEFFTTQDPFRARLLAMELDSLNTKRKNLTDQVYQAAMAQIGEDPGLVENTAIVLAGVDWPAGVIGIVASRMVERYNRPVVLLSIKKGSLARGSARSIEGVDITNAISKQSDLLEGFGGHAMAAGLAIKEEHIASFRQGLYQAVYDQNPHGEMKSSLNIDAYLSLSEINLELINDLERLAPFGPGNPPLVLAARNLSLVSSREIGRTGDHLRLTVSDETDRVMDVLWWQAKDYEIPSTRFDLAFTAHSSTFKGRKEVEITWIDSRPTILSGKPIEVIKPQRQMVDYRQVPNPLEVVKSLLEETPDTQVWAEGVNQSIPAAVNRLELTHCSNLVIWHTPPGHAEYAEVIEKTDPEKVMIFAQASSQDEPKVFIKYLAAVIKFAINHKDGQVTIDGLAAACSQRRYTIQLGLAWLNARGIIEFVRLDENTICVHQGRNQSQQTLAQIGSQLESILHETASYRAFFKRVKIDDLR
jgi:single-stranded-DNA-specific exonuclease